MSPIQNKWELRRIKHGFKADSLIPKTDRFYIEGVVKKSMIVIKVFVIFDFFFSVFIPFCNPNLDHVKLLTI